MLNNGFLKLVVGMILSAILAGGSWMVGKVMTHDTDIAVIKAGVLDMLETMREIKVMIRDKKR